MNITMYSFRPLADNLRTEFELPAWPYTKNTEHFEIFKNYMLENLVFYYTDSDVEAPDGRKLSYPHFFGFETEGLEWPIQAFMNNVSVDSNFKVMQWPQDKGETPLLTKLKACPVSSDMMAWSQWNVPVKVSAVNGISITREIMYEYLDPRTQCESECRKEEAEVRINKQ